MSSFYDMACFLILASGTHSEAAITSENIWSMDAIIFAVWMLLYLIVDHL